MGVSTTGLVGYSQLPPWLLGAEGVAPSLTVYLRLLD